MKNIILMILVLSGAMSCGQAPGSWTVDPNDFTYDMAITARLEVNGRVSASSNDVVAAFIDGVVVGVGSPDVNVPSTGEVVIFLTVYSNSASGKTVTFQIYDDQNNEVLNAVNSLAFENNAQTGSNTVPYVISDNYAPTAISLSASSISENLTAGSVVGVLSTTDANHSTGFTYQLVTGEGDTGNSFFTITGNELKTAEILNFEVKNEYSVRVQTIDPKGATFERAFVITVLDVNDGPTDIILSASTLAENNETFAQVGLLTTTDEDAGDSFVYTLTGSADDSNFEIRDGNRLVLGVVANFEIKASYSLTITVTDQAGAGLTYQESFVVNISDVNEAPTDITLSNNELDENSPTGTILGTLTTTDQDLSAGDTHIYTFINGTDSNGDFLLDGNTLKAIVVPDFEEKSTYFLTLVVKDAANNTFTKQFQINILDVNEAPNDIYLSKNTLAEDAAIGTFIGRLSVNDVDDVDTYEYAFVSGDGDTGNALFQITDDEITSNGNFDFEVKSEYEVRIQATDAGSNTFQKVFTIVLLDANDPPTNLKLSKSDFYENNTIGQEVAVISVTDQDATDEYVYSLIGTDHDDYFEINDNKLYVQQVIDYETNTTLTVTIQVTDDGGAGFSYQKQFVLTINNRNEAPTEIFVTNLSIPEDMAVGQKVADLSAEDSDNVFGEVHTFSFSSGEDTDGPFFIDGSSIKLAQKVDFESVSSYFISLMVTDKAANTFVQQFQVTIEDVNEPPNDVYLSKNTLKEDATPGTFIGRLSVNDVDNPDVFTYAFVSGDGDTNNDLFLLEDDVFLSNGTFDYEVKSEYEVRVQATDNGSNTFQKAFKINLTDANDPPTNLKLSKSDFYENNTIGQEVAVISVTDQDATDEYVFSLVGSDHDDFFEINDNKLYAQQVVDYETNTTLTITIEVTDAGGEGFSFDKEFTLTINNRNEAPTAIMVSNLIVPEHTGVGQKIADLSAEDTDNAFGELHTFSFSNGNDTSGPFFIDGNTITMAEKVNYEVKSSYFIALKVSDKEANTFVQQFTITISDENDVPTAVALSGNTFDENLPVGTEVGEFTTTDEDAGETFTYALKAGAGGGSNALFSIEDNVLKTAQVFDFEQTGSLSVRVAATDGDGAVIEKAFALTVHDTNDAPTGILLSNDVVDENQPSGTLIGVLSTDDTDASDSFSYTITGADAEQLKKFFKISGDQLQTKVPLDAEGQGQFALEITVTDKGQSTFSENFVVLVESVNEAPVLADTTLYITENSESESSLGFLNVTDVDGDDFTFEIIRSDPFFDESKGAFRIDVSGQVLVNNKDSLDYEELKEVIYRVRVTDSGSPQLTVEALLRIEIQDAVESDLLPVNEVITPNSDGYNDYFFIQNISLYEGYTLVIYKGSGVEVYRSTPYANEWNGVSQNGKDLDPGVYYYKFYSSLGNLYRGTVTIIRN